MSKGFQKLAELDRKRIVELFKEGKTNSEIMGIVGCSLSHIQHTVLEHGLVEGRLNIKRICKVVAHLIYSLDNYAEIAAKEQLPPYIVHNIANQAKAGGILFPPRTQGRPKKL